MNVISAIFALLGIVAFIVDLNLNGLYRSSFNYYSYLVLVKSHRPEFWPLGSPPACSPAPKGHCALSQIPGGVAVSPLPARPILGQYLGR